MPTEVLDQLRAMRESTADALRQDSRYLTMAALDRSIAEISGVPGATDPAPADVLRQLRVLRETIAESQRQDPRYLTLTSLDKSIAEISNVIGATDHAPASSFSFEAPAVGLHAADPHAGDVHAVDPHAVQGASLGRAAPHAGAPEAGDGEDDEGGDDPEADLAGQGTPEPSADTGEARAQAAGHSPEARESGYESGHEGGYASGYVPMQARDGAPQYQPAMSVKFGKLPNKVDLRRLMTPVDDQGETSSCVASAVAGAYEYWIRKASKQDQSISRLFVYYNARWRDGAPDEDDGSVIQLAMEGLQKFGACNEQVWPFDAHLVTQKPGADAYQDAAPFKVQDMAQVPLKLEAWKQALAEGKPIVFGCLLFETFDDCSRNGGIVPMPAPEDIGRATHGGHSMCAVGYCDTERVFIVRNSWGAEWGDKGHCYMPYAYLLNAKFNDGDCWVFVPKVPSQPPREVWSDDTKPVTNDGRGVDFPIEPYTAEQYEALPVDLFEHVRRPFNAFVPEDFAEYASFASQSLWSRMESFDVRSFLASSAAIAAVSTAFASEDWASETSADSDEMADAAQDADEASDEAQDEGEQSDHEGDEAEDAASDHEDEHHDEHADGRKKSRDNDKD